MEMDHGQQDSSVAASCTRNRVWLGPRFNSRLGLEVVLRWWWWLLGRESGGTEGQESESRYSLASWGKSHSGSKVLVLGPNSHLTLIQDLAAMGDQERKGLQLKVEAKLPSGFPASLHCLWPGAGRGVEGWWRGLAPSPAESAEEGQALVPARFPKGKLNGRRGLGSVGVARARRGRGQGHERAWVGVASACGAGPGRGKAGGAGRLSGGPRDGRTVLLGLHAQRCDA